MAKRPDGYWATYYREHRDQRLAESKRYLEQHRDAKRQYLAAYYKMHRPQWKRSRAQQDLVNARRRERYASDHAARRAIIAAVGDWRRRHPDARLQRSLSRYGISLDQYYRAVANGCAICQRPTNVDFRRAKRFHIDHCHKTKRFRGFLCSSCNLGLGKFRDDPDILARAAVYVRAHQGTTTPHQ